MPEYWCALLCNTSLTVFLPKCRQVHTYPESRNFRQSRQFRQCFDNSGRMCICRKCRNSRLSTIPAIPALPKLTNLYSSISSTIPAKFSNCRNCRSFAGIAEIFWILANTRQVTSFRQTILRGRRETWYHNRHTHKCTDRQTGPILYPRPLTLEGTKPQCHSVNIDASWLSERIIDHKTGRQCTRYVLPSVHGRWLVANWLYWGSNIGISIHNQWSNP